MKKYIDAGELYNKLFLFNGKVCPDKDIDNFDITISVREVKNAIIKAQSEDVKPLVHGKWIEADTYKNRYKCNVCLGKHTDPETGEWHEVFDYGYPFCPNCGAIMDL